MGLNPCSHTELDKILSKGEDNTKFHTKTLFKKISCPNTSCVVVWKYNTFYTYLIEPVRVENPKTAQFASSTLLCD